MRRTDGVAARVLHHLDLTDEGCLIDGGTKWTKVVVQADTLDLTGLTIQLETTLLRYLDGADTKFLGNGIEQFSILHIFDISLI